jgi:sigma-B regulation protein RsbU (phosphoserine phosphatase)
VRHGGRNWHVAEAVLAEPPHRFVTLTSVRTGLAFALARIPNPVAVLVNLAIFGSIIAGCLVAGRIGGRVLAIAEAVREDGSEPGKLQLPVDGRDELGYLAQTLNRMSTELAASIRQLQQTTAEKERLETEIRVAAQVQAWMLPRKLPELPGAGVFAMTKPARIIGGDFYDFMLLGDGRLGLVIGDSSGKGLPAALHAAQSLSVIRGLARRTGDVPEVLATVNRVLLGSGEAGMFSTVFYGLFDPAGRTLTFANAGHCPPILLRTGQPPALLKHEHSLPVGLAEQFEPIEQKARLEPDDVLVLYSDGVTDARDADEELFGMRRLMECLADGEPRDPRHVAECVSQAVFDFASTARQADDVTIVVLQAKA